MICKNCKTQNDANAKFCFKCGNLLEQESRGSVDTYLAKQTRGCQTCGSLAPTKNVHFFQIIGMIYLLQYSSIKGRLCKSCIDREFKTRTIKTLLVGWLGVISAILTPFAIAYNIIRFVPTIGMSREEY